MAFVFGLAEDAVGLFPWQSRQRWDIGHPGGSFYLHPNEPCHTMDSVHGPWNALLVIPQKTTTPAIGGQVFPPCVSNSPRTSWTQRMGPGRVLRRGVSVSTPPSPAGTATASHLPPLHVHHIPLQGGQPKPIRKSPSPFSRQPFPPALPP